MNILHRSLRRRIRLTVSLAGLLLAFALNAMADESATNAPPDADQAWKEFQKVAQPDMPPAEWQGHPTPEQTAAFRSKQGQKAGLAAEKANDFYTRFPSHPKAAEARKAE